MLDGYKMTLRQRAITVFSTIERSSITIQAIADSKKRSVEEAEDTAAAGAGAISSV
jgi:hypothetical protein